MRKWLLVFTFLVFLGLTSGFEASMQPSKRQATPESPAIFQLTVENTGNTVERLNLNYDFTQSGWLYFEGPKTVQPGEKQVLNVTIDPDSDAIQQSYGFTVYVSSSNSNRSLTFSDYMNVQRKNELNVKDFTISETNLKPGDSVTGSMTVQNLAPRIISEYGFRSSFSGMEKTSEGIAIAPAALKTYSFSYKTPEDAYPGERNFTITMDYRGTNQTSYRNITIDEVRNVTETRNSEDNILYRSGELILRNNGNSNVTVTENITLPSYLDAVTEFDPEPRRSTTQGDSSVYYWTFDLQPEETQPVEYSVNVWMPLALASAILAGILILRRITGNLKITKKVEKKDSEDTLKVSISLENNTDTLKEQIKVKDFVPNVADLNEDFHMTEPDIKRTTDGVELEWSVKDFKPGEERVIQYEVEPKVEIEEGLDLPRAEIRDSDNLKVAESKKK